MYVLSLIHIWTEHLSLRNMISSSTDDNSAVVLEFQAFRGVRNEYIVKELAAVDIRTGGYVFWLFAPPYERIQLHPNLRKTNSWLEKHYFLLVWNDGNLPYRDCLLYTSRCV